MQKLFAILFLPFLSLTADGEEGKEMAAPPMELPAVADCIPENVSKLGAPAFFPFDKGLVTAVTASSELAQKHTLQGLNHLHGGWELEASRHFAIAMKEDPRCLIAHWGMLMCILSPNPETDLARIAVSGRLLQLVEDGEGTELERGHAYGLMKYLSEGPSGAATAFSRVAKKFPVELQAEILSALFGRTGYDGSGEATPEQAEAEEKILRLVSEKPDSAIPLHAYLLIHAEAPDLRPTLEMARSLCTLVPDYPPYLHVLGHYEWRCGEHEHATTAFARAAELYATWMKDNNASPADCEGWVRAETYRVVALASKGDFEAAITAAEKIAATTPDPLRPAAPGTREILWNAKSLPARVLLRRAQEGDSAKALASLPAPADLKPFLGKSLSYWWLDGLRISLEAQRLLDGGAQEKAVEAISALSYHGEAMVKKRAAASAVGEGSEWNRSFRSLEILAAELRGRLAMAGPATGHGSAFNWFRAATDRQQSSTMLSPPTLLTPMAMRLGDYFLARNEPAKAAEAFEEALNSFPNDMETLVRLEKAYTIAKNPEKAAEAAKTLETLRK